METFTLTGISMMNEQMLGSTKEVLGEAVQHAKFHKKQMIPNI